MSSLPHSIPSPMKIQEELERMVLNDLLGPVGGPEEEKGGKGRGKMKAANEADFPSLFS